MCRPCPQAVCHIDSAELQYCTQSIGGKKPDIFFLSLDNPFKQIIKNKKNCMLRSCTCLSLVSGSPTVSTANYKVIKHISWVHYFYTSFQMCGKIRADAIWKSYYYQGPSPPAAPAKGQSAMEEAVLFLYFLFFYYVHDNLRCFFSFVSRIFCLQIREDSRWATVQRPLISRRGRGFTCDICLTASPHTSGSAKCSAINLWFKVINFCWLK